MMAPKISSAAIGRLIRNSHCQADCNRMPPRIGPIRKASPKTTPRMPSAGPRSFSGSLAAMTAEATGNIPPAPKPCNARPANRVLALSAMTSNREPAANSAILRI